MNIIAYERIISNDFDDNIDETVYDGYTGSYQTYYTFKALLKIYLDGINIYKYKGKYYSYKQIKNIYDIKSLDHSRFINDNMLEYHSNIDESFKDLFNYHPDFKVITCQCIDILENVDKNGNITDTLSNLKLIFRNVNVGNKKIKLNLSDFL